MATRWFASSTWPVGTHQVARDREAQACVNEPPYLTSSCTGPLHIFASAGSCRQLVQSAMRTSLAFVGAKMRSWCRPNSRAAASTGNGCGVRWLPRPRGRPGCVTTAATCCAHGTGQRLHAAIAVDETCLIQVHAQYILYGLTALEHIIKSSNERALQRMTCLPASGWRKVSCKLS